MARRRATRPRASKANGNLITVLGTMTGLTLVVIPEPATTLTGLALLAAVYGAKVADK